MQCTLLRSANLFWKTGFDWCVLLRTKLTLFSFLVNGAFFYALTSEGIIETVNLAYGGLSYVTKMAKNTANFLQGKTWLPDTFDQAMKILLEEMPLPPNVPGSMVKYRWVVWEFCPQEGACEIPVPK